MGTGAGCCALCSFREQEKPQGPEGAGQGLGGRGRPCGQCGRSQGLGPGWGGARGPEVTVNATPRPSESGPRACKVGRAGASWWATRRRLPPSASADGLSPRLRALRGPRARAPRKYCYSGWPLQPEADLQTRGRALPASPPSSGDRPGSRLPPRPPPGLSVPRRHSCHPAAPTAPVTPVSLRSAWTCGP